MVKVNKSIEKCAYNVCGETFDNNRCGLEIGRDEWKLRK